MAATSSSLSREEVKVVLVDTRYVVTDPTSFKAVVQSLTGKDSCVAWIEESRFTDVKTRKRPVHGGGKAESNGSLSSSHGSPVSAGAGLEDNGGNWRLPNDMSFLDFDGMMLELPPMEWPKLWVENTLP